MISSSRGITGERFKALLKSRPLLLRPWVKGKDWGPQDREPQEWSRNMIGIYSPGPLYEYSRRMIGIYSPGSCGPTYYLRLEASSGCCRCFCAAGLCHGLGWSSPKAFSKPPGPELELVVRAGSCRCPGWRLIHPTLDQSCCAGVRCLQGPESCCHSPALPLLTLLCELTYKLQQSASARRA